jgi:hypothetical protein
MSGGTAELPHDPDMIDQAARDLARDSLSRYELVRQEIAAHVRECELSRRQAQEWRNGVAMRFDKMDATMAAVADGLSGLKSALTNLILKATTGIIGTSLLIIGWLAVELYHRG